MSKETKYSLRDLNQEFASEKYCLDLIFDTLHSRECSCGGKYSLLKKRRQFQCSNCRFQIAPTAGTIFHKSKTSLLLWFFAIFIFSNAKSGISSKELERQLGVTYKCAWRILRLIRESLKQDDVLLRGDVEVDETLFGGRREGGKYNKNLSWALKSKSTIIAAKERGGDIRAKVSADTTAWSIGKFLRANVSKSGTRLLTDQSNRYGNVAAGYDRYTVNHTKKEFARGDIYVNSVESFWSHFKRSAKGTHKVISKKYLQSYLDGFVFLHNNRHNDNARFSVLLDVLLHASM